MNCISGISSSRKKKKEVHVHSIDAEVDIDAPKVDVICNGLVIKGVIIDREFSINMMTKEIMITLWLHII